MSAIALDPLIAEAKRRALRRRAILIAAGLLAGAGLGVAVWAAAQSGPGSGLGRRSGPAQATLVADVAATGVHMGISSVGTSGGVTWVSNSYYDPHAFWLTNDNGRSWHKLALPAAVYAVNPRASFGAIQFIDRQHGWLSFGRRVYRTLDGGRTWKLSDSGLRCFAARCGGVESLSFSDAQHGLAFVGVLSRGKHELFRTDDGGTTWQLVARTPSLGQTTLPNGRDGFMAVNGGGPSGPYFGPPVGALFRTTDGGSTWSQDDIAGSHSWVELPIGVFGRQVVVVQNAPNPPGGWNLGAGTVWTSADGGVHWHGAAVPREVGIPTSFSLASPRFWVFSTLRGDDLYVTTTAGHTWRKIHLRGLPPRGRYVIPPQISGLAFTSPRLGWAIVRGKMPGVVGDNTLIRTTDGGLHWTVSGPVGHSQHRHR